MSVIDVEKTAFSVTYNSAFLKNLPGNIEGKVIWINYTFYKAQVSRKLQNTCWTKKSVLPKSVNSTNNRKYYVKWCQIMYQFTIKVIRDKYSFDI
jgi:hypothetical protein